MIKAMNLPLDIVRVDGGTQSRVNLDDATVKEYTELMQAGVKFPPVVAFYDGEHYWLSDGFHRVRAAKSAGLGVIEADIQQGDQREAILHSVGANATHGLRRKPEDKRQAVMRLLKDDEWAKWSNREIARRCGVDEKTVRNYRNELTAENPQSEPGERTYITKHGTVATMNTANIGNNKPAAQPATPAFEPEPTTKEGEPAAPVTRPEPIVMAPPPKPEIGAPALRFTVTARNKESVFITWQYDDKDPVTFSVSSWDLDVWEELNQIYHRAFGKEQLEEPLPDWLEA